MSERPAAVKFCPTCCALRRTYTTGAVSGERVAWAICCAVCQRVLERVEMA